MAKKAVKLRRAINFDLDVAKLKRHYSQTNPRKAFKDIEKFLESRGFEHRQYSGYLSKNTMSYTDITSVIKDLFSTFSWLSICSNKVDVTNVDALLDAKAWYSNLLSSASVPAPACKNNSMSANKQVPTNKKSR